MKKVFFALVVLMLAGTVSAADINLGDFPLGSWTDTNYDAVWEFTSGNIRILDLNGAVLYDFSDKTVNDFRVFLDGNSPAISFSCVESGRSYKFVKPLTNTDIQMEINRTSLPVYKVTMKRK
ncbi:hypothetical protein K7I13_05710 [Brucepastera parasyntrophica]|uniref:hypothetical protein n=1 Tax=Brucepastera parasyntrophica TaxID=2880008 RepID=UPI00210AF1EE|nr:hypothetical protein [Brucepastera parasyntrophica]ULQ60764.1 hypothetical protein K7I13_05710 [Brucepastera parasyntrophica]